MKKYTKQQFLEATSVESFFEQEKLITVDAARNARMSFSAIDICKFAKKYNIRRVLEQSQEKSNW